MYKVNDIILLTDEDEQLLKNIFLDKQCDELYAIHYIISRVNLCSFMTIPQNGSHWVDKQSMKDYLKQYEEIVKPNLTQELIEAINNFDGIGADVINHGKKGYNLAKIFGYDSLDKEPAYFDYEEPKLDKQTIAMDFVTATYTESVLPYITKE